MEHLGSLLLEQYEKLPRKGKPTRANEYTIIAGIFMKINTQIELVCLGTGMKCLNPSKVLPGAVRDSHAEVIARRAFLLFLIDHIEQAMKSDSKVLYKSDDIYYLKDGISFILAISAFPCNP